MGEDNKKLITEKITGRKMTAGRVVRSLVIALVCGLLFGLAAGAVFFAVGRLGDRLEAERAAQASQASQESLSSSTAAGLAETETAEITEPEMSAEDNDSAGDISSDTSDAGQPGTETAAEDTQALDGTEEAAQETALSEESGDISGEAQDEEPGAEENDGSPAEVSSGRHDESSPEAQDGETAEADADASGKTEYTDTPRDQDGTGTEALAEKEDSEEGTAVSEEERAAWIRDIRRHAVETGSRSVVAVNAISIGTTWFDSQAENTRTFAGLVIECTEQEYLVLTTAAATGTDRIRVDFGEGDITEAYVKQTSLRDELAVLGVPRTGDKDSNGQDASRKSGTGSNSSKAAEESGISGETEENTEKTETDDRRRRLAQIQRGGREETDTEDADEAGMSETDVSEERVRPIAMADPESIFPGDPVVAIGAPLGVVHSYDFGDIGFISNAEPQMDTVENVYYADMRCNPEEGTFIINQEGELIGIASENRGDSGIDGSLARIVSISSLRDTVESLKEGRKLAFAGLQGFGVTADMTESGIPEGMYVLDVLTDGPAYNIGIKRGDIVTQINGETVTDMQSFSEAIRTMEPGAEAELTVKRGASAGEYREMNYTLTLTER